MPPVSTSRFTSSPVRIPTIADVQPSSATGPVTSSGAPRVDRFDGVTARTARADGATKDLVRLGEAANRAAVLLTASNPAEKLRPVSNPVEVDPGSRAYVAVDARGERAWVVDQKVTIPRAAPDVLDRFLNGFFRGAARGEGDGPRTPVLAVERDGKWQNVTASANNDAGCKLDPFADPSVTRFVARIEDVRVLNAINGLVPPGEMELVIDKSSAARTNNSVEFTCHFLNPDKKQGPFPGTTDGAVRFRCTRNPDDSATMEGFYVTREPTEIARHMVSYVPPMRLGRAMLSLGEGLFKNTPMALVTGMMSATARATGTLVDAAAGLTGADDAVRKAVGKLHAMYYRTVLFPNLAGTG